MFTGHGTQRDLCSFSNTEQPYRRDEAVRDERFGFGHVHGDDDDRVPGHAAVGQRQRGSDIHERSHQTGAEHAPDTAERTDPEGPGGR